MIKYKAYWLYKGENTTTKVYKVPKTHIDYIISYPKRFGLSSEEIQKVYDEFGEKLRFEGKARNKIMTKLIEDGWVRIRYMEKKHLWTVNYSIELEEVKRTLYHWYMQKEILESKIGLRMLPVKGDEFTIESNSVRKYLNDSYFWLCHV